jgi:RimJ/RimL family protein N-acetyltransferase
VLTPVRLEHHEFLYQLAIDEVNGLRWRYAGMVPRRDTFDQTIWSAILTQFIVVDRESNVPIGVVSAYNADMNHGYAYVMAAMISDVTKTGIGIEAVDLFFGHLFECYRFRVLYLEVPEYNVPQFASAIGWFLKEEGRLVQHTFYGGRFWDRFIFALHREDYGSELAVRRFGRRRRQVPIQ